MSVLPTAMIGTEFTVATHDLSKHYKYVPALRKVALQVPTGAVYLLVGPNGAGKSTTIKILLDLLRPTSGSVEVLGMDPHRHPALVRANVGYVPEQLNWGYGWMRVGRLLEHHARYFPSWDWEYAKHLSRAFQLRPDQRMSTLSKGQGRRVHIALALAHRPPVLILDEPTDGLDPVMRDDMLGVLIDHLAQTPTTVLLCTHHVTEFEQIADHIGVLRNNELCAQMPLHQLKQGLRRYRAEVPTGWGGKAMFGAAVLRRTTAPNEVDWTVWGEQDDVAHQFASSGAFVRDSATISLHDATLALLNPRETVTT
ncbi:MAG: ABC transporter ATP-binding protein [bacterium]